MANANSLLSKLSRYVHGGRTETANNRIEWWEKNNFSSDASDIVYVVENFYEGRIDLIAYAFYEEPRYWWVIAQYNNILDPATEITAGRTLLIPSKDRLPALLTGRLGGIASTREEVKSIKQVII